MEDRPASCASGRVIGLKPELILWMTFALRLAVILSPALKSTLTVHLVAFLGLILESILVVCVVVILGPTLGLVLAGSLVATLTRISDLGRWNGSP